MVIQIANSIAREGEDYKIDFTYYDDADAEAGFEDYDQIKPIYNLHEAPKLFEKFMVEYKKKYKDHEDLKAHYNTFVENLKEINRINSDKEVSSVADINLFTDLSEAERSHLFGVPGS